jgi:hypothetical protein
MSDFRFKPKPLGLSLAYQHKSAVSQASLDKVYQKIDRARIHETDLPAPVKISRGVQAIRMGIDRVSRLGERIRENKDVAPIDSQLMGKEFEYLKDKLSQIFSKNITESVGVSETEIVSHDQMQSQFARLVDAVFKGEVSQLDRIDRIGYLLDANADPLEIKFEGDFRLADLPKKGEIRTGIDTLSDNLTSMKFKDPLPLKGELSGDSYVSRAIERVSEDVLINASSALLVHSDNRVVSNMSLLFDDGYKSTPEIPDLSDSPSPPK